MFRFIAKYFFLNLTTPVKVMAKVYVILDHPLYIRNKARLKFVAALLHPMKCTKKISEILKILCIHKKQHKLWGEWWLSGRASDFRARGSGFETYLRLCCVLEQDTLLTQEVLAPSRPD